MSRFATSPNAVVRLSRASLIAFYTAIALVGSGGLHAIAPRGESNCCTHQAAEGTHAHRGCTHHHGHSHAATDSCPTSDSSPRPCHDHGCAICEFAATPAMAVAIVEPLPQVEAVDEVDAERRVGVDLVAASIFLVRGPPSAI